MGQCETGDVNSLGQALNEFWIPSPDKKIIVHIQAHTKMTDADGKRLDGIEINPSASIPDPPPGRKVLAAYNLTPEGALSIQPYVSPLNSTILNFSQEKPQ